VGFSSIPNGWGGLSVGNYRTNLARRQGRRNAKKRREAAKAAETGDA
jgi:hypothetical protein